MISRKLQDSLKIASSCFYKVDGLEIDLKSKIRLTDDIQQIWDYEFLISSIALTDSLTQVRFLSDSLKIASQCEVESDIDSISKIKLNEELGKALWDMPALTSAITLTDEVEGIISEMRLISAISLGDTLELVTIERRARPWKKLTPSATKWEKS